ncbi:MAG: D-tyrosyl-tRNA(Tyr) deacylase [Gammaproteobacteria bacterium]|nr:D-tyrosyl-tRNA(Tyr) deacylase [Gammaproteobacteria bacterium]
MLALLQRVSHAKVEVADRTIGAIDHGLLVFLAIEPNDDEKTADRLLHRVLGYRIFSDANDKMNFSVQDVNGGVLIVSQFTLAADTKKGMRPSFTSAAPPELGEKLYDYFVKCAKEKYSKIATGEFGADMQVSLCNDGPVTIIL